MCDFAVHLRQGFFSAHCEHRMPEAHKGDEPGHVRQPGSAQRVEPAERLAVEKNSCFKGVGGNLDWDAKDCVRAPQDQDYDHHGSDGHNLNSLLAGLMNALSVLPPEIKRYQRAEHGGKAVLRKMAKGM